MYRFSVVFLDFVLKFSAIVFDINTPPLIWILILTHRRLTSYSFADVFVYYKIIFIFCLYCCKIKIKIFLFKY